VQVAQALTWSARRDLQTGLLVAVGLLVLGASYAPDLVVGVPLLGGWVACVVAVVLLVRQRERDAADVVAAPLGRPAPAPLVVVGGLAVALGLVAFLLVPVPQDAGLQSRLAAQAQATAPSGGRTAGYSADELDTSVRGDLSDQPLAEVDGDSPGLWRHRAYSTWDGRRWSSPETRGGRVGGTAPYVLSDAPVGRTDDVRLLSRGGTLWAPGQVVSLSLDGPLFGDVDAGDALTGSRRVDRYTVSTARQDLSGLAQDVVGSADPRWLQLPGTTTERTRALAREITAGATGQAARVQAVEDWLGANLQYRLDSPVPEDGEDAVDRFLFVDRVGFCEHFAAAEVVLLRTLGIPARLVTGLAYGVDAGGGARTFREKDLHAWVEVPYAQAGWVASDPTAGAAQAAGDQRSFREHVAAALRSLLDALQGMPGGRVALVVLLVALCLVGALVRRRVVRRPEPPPQPDRPLTGAEGDDSALAAFLRLDRRLAARRRTPAESLSEMQRRLGLSGERADAFAVVERECYAPVRPDPHVAVEVLDRWDVPGD
jgi:transglutaminase-like putative cysteine protease